jgi:hypothetical protein
VSKQTAPEALRNNGLFKCPIMAVCGHKERGEVVPFDSCPGHCTRL